MFAASDEKNGITRQQLENPNPKTKREGGLTPSEKEERKGPRNFSSGPKNHPSTHTTQPDAIHTAQKISRGAKIGAENTMSIVFLAIESVAVNARDEKRIKKILLRLWIQAGPEMRRRISAIVARLSEILSGEGRITKHLRRHRDPAQQQLLLAGFLHAVRPDTLRRIGLEHIANIVDYERPTGLMQCLLHSAIESEKAKDRAGYLVLLDLIQRTSFPDLEDKISLCCLALDFIDSAERRTQLSDEILSARDRTLGMLQAT